MNKQNRLSVLELALALAVGAALALYRLLWAGDNGGAQALVGGCGALVLLVFAFAAEGVRGKGAPVRPLGQGGKGALLLSALTLLAAAALFWLEGMDGLSLLGVLRAVFPAAVAVAAVVRAKLGDRGRMSAMLTLFPVFYLCFYLLLFYRANANARPIVRDYGFEIAALVAVLLGMYLLSAARFDRPTPRLRAAALSLGLAGAMMELAVFAFGGGEAVAAEGFGFGTAAMLFAFAVQLAVGLFCPGARLPAPAEGQEPQAQPPVQPGKHLES